ncbi:hypothetical protein PSENEW3n2_00003900 [Picochlorum sp. SENEW3]|nr:hypothetical protein PSENEW3n2_00003900 [Picochlorum sp. SENEW3]WPT18600.1 hypothetical protein PSENEW3_00003900 [Picochlorum sp. SENEW3]
MWTVKLPPFTEILGNDRLISLKLESPLVLRTGLAEEAAHKLVMVRQRKRDAKQQRRKQIASSTSRRS